jgi:transcriptional regulator with XRE-family HTH domain
MSGGVNLLNLGEKIRNLRKEKAIKMVELAEMTGLSQSFLSQVENGVTNPSVSALQRIALALGVSTAYFFDRENNGVMAGIAGQGVVRKNQRKGLLYPDSNITYQLLSPDLQGPIEFLYITAPPGSSTGEYNFVHQGMEYVLVLKGKMELTFGQETHHLEEGDSACFASSLPHHWKNVGDEELVAVVAVTPPSF